MPDWRETVFYVTDHFKYKTTSHESQSAMNAKTLIEALHLWETTGSAVAQAAKETSEVLAKNNIPNLLAGGLAVQLHGYPRFTDDVDLIVPDVEAAHRLLLAKGFKQSLQKMISVVHPSLKVTVDLLPAGRCLLQRCSVPFPQPKDTGAIMQPVTIEELVSLKLDSYSVSPARRARDRSDVVELIMRAGLSRDLPVSEVVREDYQKIWDAIAAESAANPALPES
jgi:hypothetical protein